MIWQLIALFARMSVLAVGGVNSTVPEIARQTVDVLHWLTPQQFAQLFAIANAAPGPNMMISTVIGAHMDGVPGGLVATLAMVLPSGVLVIVAATFWERYRENRWRGIIQRGLLPVSAGLLLSAAAVLVRQADTGWVTIMVTALCTALAWRSRVHPLWLMAGGVVVGLVAL
jgi:chromate transporter